MGNKNRNVDRQADQREARQNHRQADRRYSESLPPNSEMGSKLNDAVRSKGGITVTNSFSGKKSLLRSPDQWKDDGEDHINIHYQGATDLGKQLEFGFRLRFAHDIFGQFDTIEGFKTYLRSDERPEDLRYVVGRQLQELKRAITNRPGIINLNAMVMDATYQRIKSNDRLHGLMYNNELPFDMYYVLKTGVPVRHADHVWVMEGFAEIQAAIHGQRRPDFTFMCALPNDGKDYIVLSDPNNPEDMARVKEGQTVIDLYKSVRPVISESMKKRIEAARKPKSVKPHREMASVSASVDSPVTHDHTSESDSGTATKPATSGRVEQDVHVFSPEARYSLLVPAINDQTDKLFLDVDRKVITINDVPIETGLVVAGVNLPLLQLSHNNALAAQGLISTTDVVRSSPVLDRSFFPGFTTNNVVKLGRVAINYLTEADGTEELVSFDLVLKLINMSFDKEGDHQIVTILEDGTVKIDRHMYLYKPMDLLLDENGIIPEMFKAGFELARKQEGPKQFRYLIMDLWFEFTLRTDVKPEICLTGSVRVEGASTGSRDDKNRQVVFLDDSEKKRSYSFAGYNFVLYRGALRTEGMSTAPVKPVNIVVDDNAETQAIKDDALDQAVDEDNGVETTSSVEILAEAMPAETTHNLLDEVNADSTPAVLDEEAMVTELQTESVVTTDALDGTEATAVLHDETETTVEQNG